MQEDFLLVDGYNIIHAWDELRELVEEVSLESARWKLMDMLSNYKGVKKTTIILVFDAYLVKGNPRTGYTNLSNSSNSCSDCHRLGNTIVPIVLYCFIPQISNDLLNHLQIIRFHEAGLQQDVKFFRIHKLTKREFVSCPFSRHKFLPVHTFVANRGI